MVKKCPICRAQRGFSETSPLNGMDEFLRSITTVLEPPSDAENESDTPSDDNDSDPFNFHIDKFSKKRGWSRLIVFPLFNSSFTSCI